MLDMLQLMTPFPESVVVSSCCICAYHHTDHLLLCHPSRSGYRRNNNNVDAQRTSRHDKTASRFGAREHTNPYDGGSRGTANGYHAGRGRGGAGGIRGGGRGGRVGGRAGGSGGRLTGRGGGREQSRPSININYMKGVRPLSLIVADKVQLRKYTRQLQYVHIRNDRYGICSGQRAAAVSIRVWYDVVS